MSLGDRQGEGPPLTPSMRQCGGEGGSSGLASGLGSTSGTASSSQVTLGKPLCEGLGQ